MSIKTIVVPTYKTRASLVRDTRKHGVSELLGIEADSKTIKGKKQGYNTGIMYLVPDDSICPGSVRAGCQVPCLVSAGLPGVFKSIGIARANKTALFKNDLGLFFALLIKDIERAYRKHGETLVIRLNGTSDIQFEDYQLIVKGGRKTNIMSMFPGIQFYDYTKLPNRFEKGLPPNYHLTLSYSGANTAYANSVMTAAYQHGASVAVVFRDSNLPATWKGLPVINGDDTDLRFLDTPGVIVGLKAKGKAKQDQSGFVVDADIIVRGV